MRAAELPLLAGRYRLIDQLGAGGMAVVWRAFDEVLGRRVAVKTPTAAVAAKPELVRRLLAEAQAVAQLTHPHIAFVHDYGQTIGPDGLVLPYLVMELVDGVALSRLAPDGEGMPWEQAVEICAQVSLALAAAHARGIVHRDITPNNIMVTRDGVKVVDFGISAFIGDPDSDDDEEQMLGTAAYVSPERIDGQDVAAPADVYALGLVLYRCLTGRLPWAATENIALLHAHMMIEPEPLPSIVGLPAEVYVCAARCLRKDPSQRPTAAEVARLLSTAAGLPTARALPLSASVAADQTRTTMLPSSGEHRAAGARLSTPAAAYLQPTGGNRRKRRRASPLLIAGAVTLAAAGGLYALLQSGSPRAQAEPGVGAGCLLAYTEVARGTEGFQALLNIQTIGMQSQTTWRLEFRVPAGYVVESGASRAGSMSLRQDGQHVTALGSPLVPASGRMDMKLIGANNGAHERPSDFRINDRPCQLLAALPAQTAGPSTPQTSWAPTEAWPSQQPDNGVPLPPPSAGPAVPGATAPPASPSAPPQQTSPAAESTGPTGPRTGPPTSRPTGPPSRPSNGRL